MGINNCVSVRLGCMLLIKKYYGTVSGAKQSVQRDPILLLP